MDTRSKKCPYCGEEILATAKKCKHCGEWLYQPMNDPAQQTTVTKESYFNQKYLYDCIMMKILFWVTILGSLIIEIHSLGLENKIGFLPKKYFFVTLCSKVPEWLGFLLSLGGEALFLFLLMKAMSHLHKPLKGIFLWNIIWYAGFGLLIATISILGEDISGEDYAMGTGGMIILGCVFFLPLAVLGAQIKVNYEASIQKLGIVILFYVVIGVIIGVVNNAVTNGLSILMSIISIAVDVSYFGYLRKTLTDYGYRA